MPFEMLIEAVEYNEQGTTVTGKLLSGQYQGPEQVVVDLDDQFQFHSIVKGLYSSYDQRWPILPEHGASLNLTLRDTPKPYDLPIGGLLKGVGGVQTHERVLSNDYLEQSIFWAVHFYLLSFEQGYDEADLCYEQFGFTADEVNEFYLKYFTSQRGQRAWPYFRCYLNNGSFVEVEYADDGECQTRYRIGFQDRCLLLGYESSHFSLPCFRWGELRLIAANARGGDLGSAMTALLLLPAVSLLPEEVFQAQQLVRECFATLNVFQSTNQSRLINNICNNRVSKSEWHYDDNKGWLNTSPYSQRNPQGELSLLGDMDYQVIKGFFAAL